MHDDPSGTASDIPRIALDNGSTLYLVLICFVATLGGLLFGYDTAVIAGAIGFLEKHFALEATAEGWAAACALAGCALGAAAVGPLSDRLGRKRALVVSAVLFIVSSIGTAIPQTFWLFVVFRFIGGIGIGAASMTSPMYIAEVSPARLRGRMVSLNQFAIVTGMLLVGVVNYLIARAGTDAWTVDYGWRLMFASGVLPAVLFFFLLLPVPESPRWLTEKGRRAEARAVLARVNGALLAEQELASIEEAIAMESGSLRQLLEPGLRTVLIIGVALAVLQQVTGINVFLYFAPQIFKRIAGEGTEAALLQTVVVNAVNMLFTVIAIWTVDRLGRRTLMMIGFLGMTDQPAGLESGRLLSKGRRVDVAFHAGLHRLFCSVRGARDVGPAVGDFPHADSRSCHGDRHRLFVAGQPGRDGRRFRCWTRTTGWWSVSITPFRFGSTACCAWWRWCSWCVSCRKPKAAAWKRSNASGCGATRATKSVRSSGSGPCLRRKCLSNRTCCIGGVAGSSRSVSLAKRARCSSTTALCTASSTVFPQANGP